MAAACLVPYTARLLLCKPLLCNEHTTLPSHTWAWHYQGPPFRIQDQEVLDVQCRFEQEALGIGVCGNLRKASMHCSDVRYIWPILAGAGDFTLRYEFRMEVQPQIFHCPCQIRVWTTPDTWDYKRWVQTTQGPPWTAACYSQGLLLCRATVSRTVVFEALGNIRNRTRDVQEKTSAIAAIWYVGQSTCD